MKKQVYNPFLPLDVYIPDGEPHIFGDRIYLFGSHDKEDGDTARHVSVIPLYAVSQIIKITTSDRV